MEIVGLRFYKTQAESQKEMPFTSIQINMNIDKLKKEGNALRVDFSYGVDYQPKVAKLLLQGYLMIRGEKKELDDIVKAWKKKKMLPKELSKSIANTVAYASQVNGVLIAKAISIPSPVIPPSISLKS